MPQMAAAFEVVDFLLAARADSIDQVSRITQLLCQSFMNPPH